MHSLESKIQETIRAPLGGVLLRPDSQVTEREGWYHIITPSARSFASLNEVVISKLSTDEADRIIDETIARHRALKLPLKWCVYPGSSPDDLGERLERRGFQRWLVRGMTCNPFALQLNSPSDVTVNEVGENELEEYIDTCMAGWDIPASERQHMLDDHAKLLAKPERKNLMYLARCRTTPAGTAALVCGEHSGYLAGGVVIPEFRGKGIYRALIAKRLETLRLSSISLAVTQAREQTSAPILEKLGFETVFRGKVYQLQ